MEELAHHKYQVLEDCLYYKVSQDASAMQGKSNAISILPPSIAAGETLDTEILGISLRQLWMVYVYESSFFFWPSRKLKFEFSKGKFSKKNFLSASLKDEGWTIYFCSKNTRSHFFPGKHSGNSSFIWTNTDSWGIIWICSVMMNFNLSKMNNVKLILVEV